MGLPVRTGVEGLVSAGWPQLSGSPCANRGRRFSMADVAAGPLVSLCEQGSKAARTECHACKPWVSLCEQGSKDWCRRAGRSYRGLPVRTGVEGSAWRTWLQARWSPCANRGRRLQERTNQITQQVSLCEQGWKEARAVGSAAQGGCPVHARSRRGIRLAVSLCEQGDRNGRKQRPSHLRLAPRT